jgi:hypothetical protein
MTFELTVYQVPQLKGKLHILVPRRGCDHQAEQSSCTRGAMAAGVEAVQRIMGVEMSSSG